jgi:hypothetical protein
MSDARWLQNFINTWARERPGSPRFRGGSARPALRPPRSAASIAGASLGRLRAAPRWLKCTTTKKAFDDVRIDHQAAAPRRPSSACALGTCYASAHAGPRGHCPRRPWRAGHLGFMGGASSCRAGSARRLGAAYMLRQGCEAIEQFRLLPRFGGQDVDVAHLRPAHHAQFHEMRCVCAWRGGGRGERVVLRGGVVCARLTSELRNATPPSGPGSRHRRKSLRTRTRMYSVQLAVPTTESSEGGRASGAPSSDSLRASRHLLHVAFDVGAQQVIYITVIIVGVDKSPHTLRVVPAPVSIARTVEPVRSSGGHSNKG